MSEKHNVDTNEVLLARIDERTKRLEEDFIDFKEKISSNLVTKEEFNPVRNLVYGGVTLVLTTVGGAILYLVVRNG
jgi:hypothetical protein